MSIMAAIVLAVLATAQGLLPTSAQEAGSLQPYPPEARTGNAPVDAVIEAVLGADTIAIQSAMVTSPIPCTTPEESIPGYPGCPEGAPPDTPVDLFPFGACQPNFVDLDLARELVTNEFSRVELDVYAAWEAPDSVSPLAAYRVVFGAPATPFGDPAAGKYGAAVDIDESGAIVAVTRCAGPENMVTPMVMDYLLPPLSHDATSTPTATEEPTRTGDTPPADTVAFGEQIADLASSGNVDTIAAYFVPRQYTCPIDPVYTSPACEGIPDGTVVEGYPLGRFHSEGGVTTREGVPAALSGAISEFSSQDFQLYTVSTTSPDRDCPECAHIVLSTPQDADTSDGSALVLVFLVSRSGGSFEIKFMMNGLISDIHGDELNIIRGGTSAGTEYVRVMDQGETPTATATVTAPATPTREVPNPPETGSGLAADSARDLMTWSLLGAGVGTLILGAAAIAAARHRARS
jgi:hypothetical protein